MSARGVVKVQQLRDALAEAGITDLASAEADAKIRLQVEPDFPDLWMWPFEVARRQHDAFTLDGFITAAIGGDRATAAALAPRLFTDRNLDLVERRLVRH